MRVLLWHLDGKLPNLALMRIAAHHRSLGDDVTVRKVSNPSALDAAGHREILVENCADEQRQEGA